MNARADVRIAGDKTVGQWKDLKSKLTVGGTPELWEKAFREFFLERLHTRYFAPIKILMEPDSHRKNSEEPWHGEGFAIVALQCSLIEFLGATLKGQTYIHPRELGNRETTRFEYKSSGKMFVEFLTQYPPFKEVFTTDTLAWDFYNGVRNGLMHEARTKKGWTIRTRPRPGPFLDVKAKIVYRDDLQRAFDGFTKWYGSELPKNKDYQEAFIHKFDSLCVD